MASDTTPSTEAVATYLAEVRKRAEAATRGPWESEDDEDCWRLFGAVAPELHPLQLIKAPKRDTPFAEYWPRGADAEFIAHARTDVPRLLAALEAVLAQHQRGRIVIFGALCAMHEAHRHFSITSTEAAAIVACPECAATVYDSCAGCGPQVHLDSCPARTAISAALLGEADV